MVTSTLQRKCAKRDHLQPVARKRILAAAAKLFRERGFKGTTVRDIAEAAGILSGSLFYHFRSKEEMLVEIMRDAALSMCERAESVMTTTAQPQEQLKTLINLELDHYLSETGDSFAILFLEWREVPGESKPELIELRNRYVQVWRQVLTDCERQGHLRTDAMATERVLHSALFGATFWFKQGGRYTISQYADLIARLIFI